jgi:tRNA threonylcarbamoyladenosine biosynthesis protein TsaB
MNILGFDTATRATAVALLTSGAAPIEARDDPASGERPHHTTRLLPLVAEVLGRAGVGWDEIDRIAVGVGPGTFTGLRIGIATAKGLATARRTQLVGVSTLQSLAVNARSRAATMGLEFVMPVLDARRGEAFAAAWRTPEVAQRELAMLAAAALAPEALATRAAELGSSVLAIGEGAVEFREVLERSGAFVPDDESELHRVTAIGHCMLAVTLPASGPEEIRPEYLRLPDAELARRGSGSP